MNETRTTRQIVKRDSSSPRYRLISPDGKEYAAFRLKAGVPLYHVTRYCGEGLRVEVVE